MAGGARLGCWGVIGRGGRADSRLYGGGAESGTPSGDVSSETIMLLGRFKLVPPLDRRRLMLPSGPREFDCSLPMIVGGI